MKIKVSEATEIQIDYMVAQCEGIDALAVPERRTGFAHVEYRSEKTSWDFRDYAPTTNPAQAWPIIEREEITIDYRDGETQARKWMDMDFVKARSGRKQGLIAAMRCYVVSKLGDEVDVPKELL